MSTAGRVQQRIDAYLSSLRRGLRGIDDEDARDIVEELRAHITDKASVSGEVTLAAVEAALAGLGTPEELASQYMTDELMSRAAVSRSPIRILESLFGWASLSVAGFLVLLSSILGYFVGGAFALCGVLKIIHPRTAGLWAFRDSTGNLEISLRLGFGSAPVGGRDMVGWWMVPIGLAIGCGLVMLTTRFALWCARRYRRSLVLPPR